MKNKFAFHGASRRTSRSLVILAVSAAFSGCFSGDENPPGQAGLDVMSAKQQALTIYSRVAGVAPSQSELDQMEGMISQGNKKAAAQIATSSYHFYNLNLLRFAKPLHNVAGTTQVPFNDAAALVVGMVRDNVPFDQILYGDILYRGIDGLVNANYAANSNDHFQQLEGRLDPLQGANAIDLRSSSVFIQVQQSAANGLPDVAGVLTTRAYGEEMLSAGTNRRPNLFAFKSYLCRDYEQMADASLPDTMVGRDVDRFPTGNPQTYLTNCKGCHAGQDGLRGAWAFFNFNGGAVTYSAPTVQGKLNQNGNVYPPGYVTTTDLWENSWPDGHNADMEWRGNYQAGNGVNSLGRALAATKQFSRCMAKRAFEFACARPSTGSDESTIEQIAEDFDGSYNLREAIENAAISNACLGI